MARTTGLTKIERSLYEPTFYKVIQGGASASKTYSIMTLLVGYCESYPGAIVTVVGMTYDHLAAGVMRNLHSIMGETNRWDDTCWNKTEKIYYFKNGSIMEFKSVDRMTARGPRRDVLFVNEANGITYEVFEQLATRTRDFVIIDFNPSSKFWAHEELVEKKPEQTSFLTLTYLDNEALSAQERANIESHKPKPGEQPSNWWSVYGLGQIGVLEGNVFSGWEEATEDYIKKNGKLVRYGLDFGFSNDETGMAALYQMPESNRLGIIELIYERGILGSQYPARLARAGIDPNVLIVADSARPEHIAEIKNAGYRIIGADKNPGSVLRSIDRVAQHQIIYCGVNLKREYLAYHWRKKRSGETIDEPEDGFDHLIDSIRYSVDDLSKRRIEF